MRLWSSIENVSLAGPHTHVVTINFDAYAPVFAHAWDGLRIVAEAVLVAQFFGNGRECRQHIIYAASLIEPSAGSIGEALQIKPLLDGYRRPEPSRIRIRLKLLARVLARVVILDAV